MITFQYADKVYRVSDRAYDQKLIVLPTGAVLEVIGGWSETFPPKPKGLSEVENIFTEGFTPEEVAKVMDAALAIEIRSS